MSVVIILMLASLAVGLVFVGAFVWSVRSGQYEDTLTPSMRMLLDDATTGSAPQASKSAVSQVSKPAYRVFSTTHSHLFAPLFS